LEVVGTPISIEASNILVKQSAVGATEFSPACKRWVRDA
jgi:hypothetical protein